MNLGICHFTKSQILKFPNNRIIKLSLPLAGFLISFLGAVLFSTKAIIVKLAFADTEMDAVSLLTLRMVFSLPFYLVAAWLARRSQAIPGFTRRQWWIIIGLGLFGYYLSSLFDFVGLQYISAGLERLILFLYPSFVVLINAVLFREKISRMQQAALALTYAGIGIAYFGELGLESTGPEIYWGSCLIFFCAITYSIYLVGSGRMIRQIGATRFTASAMLSATAGVFLHFLLRGDYTQVGAMAQSWHYGLLLALLATVIPTFLISLGIKKIGSNNVAIVSAIGPVSTILQAHWILGEPIFAAQLVGTLLVIAGILLIGWKTRKNLEENS